MLEQSDRPLVSVLMPVYNAAEFVRDTLSSLAEQRVDWELVVQDGGSTDGTLTIIDQFAQSAGGQVHVVSAADHGQADALNLALNRARGSYCVWLNADDLLLPGGLAGLLAESVGADVVYGDWALADARGKTIRSYCPGLWSREKFFDRGMFAFSGAILIRRELAQATLWTGDLHYCMDLDWCLRLPIDLHAVHAHVPVAALRWHEAAKSSRHPWRFVSEAWGVRRRAVRGPRDLARAVAATGWLAAATASTPVRHSAVYRALRPHKSF